MLCLIFWTQLTGKTFFVSIYLLDVVSLSSVTALFLQVFVLEINMKFFSLLAEANNVQIRIPVAFIQLISKISLTFLIDLYI